MPHFSSLSLVVLLSLLLGLPAASNAATLPRPAGLEPQVQFWTRIYSEVGTNGGLIHDSREMGVVYEVMSFPKSMSQRRRSKKIEATKDKYEKALRSLARGKRTKLSSTEKHVLALWPDGVPNSTLSGATKRLRFQLGQADKFRAGVIRAGAWQPYIREVFRREGIPEEIAALPHVESSFNPTAYSRLGAAGMWQFMRSTGKRYLQVDYAVDERLDPYKSTDAAAKLLKANYKITGSWPLAVTAYNHGATGMKRAKKKLGTDDIVTIVKNYKSRTFGFASRNFYAELLAASHVEQNAFQYFGPLKRDQPIPFESVEIRHYYPFDAIQKALAIPASTLKIHNPSLRSPVLTGQKYVPRGYVLHLPQQITRVAAVGSISGISDSQRFSKQHRDKYYKVRRGDTLSSIARKVRVRERDLMAANNLRNRNRIYAGQILHLPGFAKTPTQAPTRVASQTKPFTGPRPKTYRVRKGDTISSISGRFGMTPNELLAANNLRNKNRIYAGQVLSLPGGKTPTATLVAAAPEAAKTPTRETTEAPKEATPQRIASIEPAPVPAALEEEPPVIGPPLPAVASPAPGLVPLTADRFAIRGGERIHVEAEETVGHYAEWLGVSASHLRRLNRMKYKTPLAIGRSFRLDFSEVSAEEFQQQRFEYHRSLQEDFFAAYQVTTTEERQLRSGDTLWSLARGDEEVPIWLLIQYNPEVDFSALHPGTRVQIPRIEPREKI